MRQLALIVTVQVRNVYVVRMQRVISRVDHAAGFVVNIDEMQSPLARRHLRGAAEFEIGAEEVSRSFKACFEKQRASIFRPPECCRNQVETVDGKTRSGTTLTRYQPNLRVSAPLRRADERDGFSVRRPARRAVGLLGNRYFLQRPSRGIHHPDVLVAALIELLSGAIGNECDSC